MNDIFWIIPNRLGGRPGPILRPWDLRELRKGGIDAIVSLAKGLCTTEQVTAAGIEHAFLPLPDKAPPEPGDDLRCVEALQPALRFVEEQLERNRTVIAHCYSGKDRTGLLLAYYLAVHEGLSPEDAVAKVRLKQPIALNAEGWEEMGYEVMNRLLNHKERWNSGGPMPSVQKGHCD